MVKKKRKEYSFLLPFFFFGSFLVDEMNYKHGQCSDKSGVWRLHSMENFFYYQIIEYKTTGETKTTVTVVISSTST